MLEKEVDVVVVGSGPGGEGAAMKLSKSGHSVAVVEAYPRVGGGCTHWSTIPSKSLRQAVQQMLDFRSYALLHGATLDLPASFPQLLKAAEKVIDRQVSMRQGFYDRNNVEVLHGFGCFTSPNTMEIMHDDAVRVVVRAKHFVLAIGSHPYRPADIDFSHPRIKDSDTILKMKDTPSSVTIYGAGIVGCEYASIFRTMGIKVNLVNTRDKLLAFLDDEIIDALAYHLRDQGVLIRHNEEYASVEGLADGAVLDLKSGKRLKTDILLWANGRAGNTVGMNLDKVGVALNQRGGITVNENYQTSQPHIYAVGDVIGFPSLASAAYDQGRFAATHIVEGSCVAHLVDDIPTGIYTSPEISSIGKTERELTQDRVPYEVGHSFFKSLARAQITGQTVGMLKILFHRETLRILGIHCFGNQAAEIIHIGQAIMSQEGPGNTLMYFINTTFNYPTMAEAYRVAALNGLNRVF